MESVNDIFGEIVQYLTGTPFRSDKAGLPSEAQLACSSNAESDEVADAQHDDRDRDPRRAGRTRIRRAREPGLHVEGRSAAARRAARLARDRSAELSRLEALDDAWPARGQVGLDLANIHTRALLRVAGAVPDQPRSAGDEVRVRVTRAAPGAAHAAAAGASRPQGERRGRAAVGV